jgi:cellulose synthase/poly-beta-1,6-N-acetylglucosamine synthase-like glycosyltransferase
LVQVIVVDNSDDEVFAENERAWATFVRHLHPDPDLRYRYGKVNNVVTGIRHATHDAVVIADDDVRWDLPGLRAASHRLQGADVVIPQNFFDPRPWHAVWDTGRTLINRATGIDYPGTLVVRRTRLMSTGGYDGEAIFENLELVRTVVASGGTVRSAPDLYVRRLPPDTYHFWSQRVRQAYDEFALPHRMVVWLAVVPVAAALVVRRRWRSLAGLAVLPIAVAEVGRQRYRGSAVFPWTASLLAPAWVLERGVCMWAAVGARFRGGAKYAGTRFPLAAHSVDELRIQFGP